MGRLRQTTEEIQNILDEAEGLRPIVEQNAEAMATLNGDGDGSVESRAEKKIKDNTDSTLSTTSENPVMNKVITVALNEKVDKVSGKGLSTNDYTTSEKDKLASLENYNDSEIKSQLTELANKFAQDLEFAKNDIETLENEKVFLTKAEYDSLEEKDKAKLYFVFEK